MSFAKKTAIATVAAATCLFSASLVAAFKNASDELEDRGYQDIRLHATGPAGLNVFRYETRFAAKKTSGDGISGNVSQSPLGRDLKITLDR